MRRRWIIRTLRAKSGPERPTVQWERCDEEPVASNINLGGRFRRGIFAGKRVYNPWWTDLTAGGKESHLFIECALLPAKKDVGDAGAKDGEWDNTDEAEEAKPDK